MEAIIQKRDLELNADAQIGTETAAPLIVLARDFRK